MQVQINTDASIQGSDGLAAHVSTVVEQALARFDRHITRVEVHLSDVNAHKGGDRDLRCVVEARLQHRQPMATTEHATTLDQAVQGAAGKLARMLDTVVGRMEDRRPGAPSPEA